MKLTEYKQSLINILQTEIVEVLNYSGIICRVNPNDYDKLEYWLKLDYCNKLYRLEYIKNHHIKKCKNLFYIENCDLQNLVGYELKDKDNYTIADIVFKEDGFIIKLDVEGLQ